MNFRFITVIIFVLSLSACVGNARKGVPWTEVSDSQNISCNVSAKTTGVLFASKLVVKETNTNLAPDSIIVVDVITDTANTFIVRKRMRRYIASIGNYSTLAALEILVSVKRSNNLLILRPVKKKEYQMSVVGKWPFPKMDMKELVNYFGSSCKLEI